MKNIGGQKDGYISRSSSRVKRLDKHSRKESKSDKMKERKSSSKNPAVQNYSEIEKEIDALTISLKNNEKTSDGKYQNAVMTDPIEHSETMPPGGIDISPDTSLNGNKSESFFKEYCKEKNISNHIRNVETENSHGKEEVLPELATQEKQKTKYEKTQNNEDGAEKTGWQKLGTGRIVFSDKLKEYVYEISEPQLNDEELAIKERLIHLFMIQTDIDVSGMDEYEKIKHLEEVLGGIIERNNFAIDNHSKDKIFYYIFQEFTGYGKIDVLLHDDEIEDISCDGQGIPIFIYHRGYDSIKTNVLFNNDEELDSFVVKLAQVCGKQISVYEPIIDGKLPDGSRLQTTLGKTVTQSSTFTIRKFRDNPLTPTDLIDNNTLSIEMVSYFWMIMEYGASILFCGGTASGKTTALNALSLFIPPSFKIVSIEDTREINLPHENWIAGTTRSGFSTSEKDKSGKDIDMFDLIRAALRQRPRVIIVGEVRGKEAYSLFQAMATGHLSYSTVHASDMQTLIQRLESPPISLPRALLTSLDVIVFIKSITTADGKVSRRITSTVEIIKLDPESKRLISVTPFSWVSPIDDRFKYSGGSNILDKIKSERGWSGEQLNKELSNRKQVLEWMRKNNIRSYRQVGKIVAEYKKDPAAVLERTQKDAA